MDQGVLVSIKWHYRKKILEEFVLQEDSGKSVVDFIMGINMLNVVDLISASSDEIEPKTLRQSWWKIILLEDDAQDDSTHSQCTVITFTVY